VSGFITTSVGSTQAKRLAANASDLKGIAQNKRLEGTFGTDSDQGGGIALDASGNAYVTGYTRSSDFPTTAGAYQTKYAGGFSPTNDGDAFLTKLNANGTALLYSTYLGGSARDYGIGIATSTTFS
jgi:hypothetical protein